MHSAIARPDFAAVLPQQVAINAIGVTVNTIRWSGDDFTGCSRGATMSINWRDNFNIGIPEIDSQHRELFSRLDKLEVALKEGHGREIIIKTFHFLDQYVHLHFNAEEQLQSFYDYPHQAMHVSEHNAFKKRLRELEDRLASEDPSEQLAAHTHAFLTQWLISHVTALDKELAGYLSDAQAKQWRQWQKNQF